MGADDPPGRDCISLKRDDPSFNTPLLADPLEDQVGAKSGCLLLLLSL